MTTMTRERPVRAVVIDDTTDIRDLLRIALSASGMDVVGEACDGQEGVDLVRDSRPDVVILDLAMPVMDGSRGAAAHPGPGPGRADHRPVGVRRRGEQAGHRLRADGYLLKGTPLREIVAYVDAKLDT